MNREEFINILKRMQKGTISRKEIDFIISEYCKAYGKSEDIIKKFLPMLTSPLLINSTLKTSLKYFETKFNVCKIHKNNELILIF